HARGARAGRGAVQHCARGARVRRGIAAGDLGPLGTTKSQVLRRKVALADRTVRDLPGPCVGGGADLVETVASVNDERALGPELDQGARDRLTERGARNAEEVAAHAGGIRKRTEHIEDGTGAELAPHGL